MDKNLFVVAGDQVHDIVVQPGTTAADVLKSLSLPDDYWISKRNGQPLGETEVLWEIVKDGEKLFASPEARVARVA